MYNRDPQLSSKNRMSRTAKVTTAITAVAALSGAGILAAGNSGHSGIDSIHSSKSLHGSNSDNVIDTIDVSKLDPAIICEAGPETTMVDLTSGGNNVTQGALKYAADTLRAEGVVLTPNSPEVERCAAVILATTTQVTGTNGEIKFSVPTVLRVNEP